MFASNKKKAIESYIKFMNIEDSEVMKNSIVDLSSSLEKIETKINKMVFDKKS